MQKNWKSGLEMLKEKFMNNQYYYYSYWCNDDKEMNDKISVEEAQKRFDDKNQTGNTFYILVGDEEKPKYIINYVNHDMITISALNDSLDPYLELEYETMDNIDKDRLFLVRYITREYDENHNQIKATVTGFATLDYNDGDHLYTILDYPIYEELDNITNIEERGKIDTPIDEEALWRDYPKFGEWDFMINDIESFLTAIKNKGDK